MKRLTKSGNPSAGSSFGGFGAFGGSSTTSLSYITPPPDLSNIPHQIVVPFKNLLKKDSTTKAKALEELLSYVQEHDGELEDPILEAWALLYARVSIDNSRRVRELSHTLLLELMKSAKRRMEKRIPTMVGPWLAGSFDRDKVVSRAATDGISSFLNTKEKETRFWIKCQQQILDYATEAMLETPDTLSDERSCSKEDALAKYYRVTGGSLCLVLTLVDKVSVGDIEDRLSKFLAIDAVWSMAAADEPLVRRSLYQLLQILLDKRPKLLEPRLGQIGRILVSDSLKSSQVGSAASFVQALTHLTKSYPQVWGTKTHPLQRLRLFVEKGSQGGDASFWQNLDQLLTVLPKQTSPVETAAAFLKSMRIGISGRQEPRSNAHHAWGSYLRAFVRLLETIRPNVNFVEDNFFPIVRQYLHPTQEQHLWSSPTGIALSPTVWVALSRHPDSQIRSTVGEEWQRLSTSILSSMANSLPEVSREHEKSQLNIAGEGERWFALASAIKRHLQEAGTAADLSSLQDAVTNSTDKIVQEALSLLSRRNYKPFGVAAVLRAAFKSPVLLGRSGPAFATSLFPVHNETDLDLLVVSPSFAYLASCLDQLTDMIPDRFEAIWVSLVDAALRSDPAIAVTTLNPLLSLPAATPYARRHDKLQGFLASHWLTCTKGAAEPSSWELCKSSLEFESIPDSTLGSIIIDLVHQLETSPPTSNSVSTLRALELITERRPSLISNQHDAHVELITKLLALTELKDTDIAAKAATLQAHLDQKSTGERPLVTIIQRNLESASVTSLGLDVLTQRAVAAFKAGNAALEDLFPSSNLWLEQLSMFFQKKPSSSLALTSSMGGAYFLVRPTPARTLPSPQRDGQGRSIPARMAIYTGSLLSSGIPLASLPDEFYLELLYLMSLTAELASDQLTLAEDGGLWDSLSARDDSVNEIADFITLSQTIINKITSSARDWRENGLAGTSLVNRFIDLALQHSGELSPLALYSAKVLCSVLQTLTETHGTPPSRLEEWFKNKGIMKASTETAFATAACLVGFGEALVSSDSVKTLCNRLMSEMIGAFPGLEKTLYSVVIQNICFSVYEAGQIPVDIRRQTLALKQMTSWTDTPGEVSSGLATEICKGITRILPSVRGVYGPYWEQALEYCILLWTEKAKEDAPADRLPYIHASLKLVAALQEAEDSSEDLEDALKQYSEKITLGLVELLKLPPDLTQPGQIVSSFLGRMVSKSPVQHISNLADIYGLVASDSREIQTAAFGILHRTLPAAQEKLAVDVLLDNKVASLPAELLSLLLDAPTLEAYPEEVLVTFPATIRCYLLAWHLIFDCFGTASLKLQSDYAESLKKHNAVGPFLKFLFDVLGLSAGQELRLDKENFSDSHIRSYDINLANDEPEERSMNWLLIHLLFLTLKYTPGLFRTWYLECEDKPIKRSLEPWLTKYFSPLIISDALDEVAKWVDEQDAPADEPEFAVKISRAAREVIASYEVDDETASMVIRIPAAFPLDRVDVVGVKRVAVDEKKWQAWMLATQGVIQFGNGGITDGLSTFRRNFVGTMKGQDECAICYSIVSTEKRLPDKTCGTCKHSFHRICLYKWFQNSGKNSCPLCRNPIDYIGSDSKRRVVG
ncbi:hypothetical protein QBC47DRAFT_151355 [Echria macrotheca]|uniref:E3 ubiquitin-protein ligase listerin n=1 Tax=Echria macrotheca TaxID=438768 RepID=A0AAJ0B0N1_9PEZI|nr:hypothetical protein QBC47DRAFT_151355 [Echria macrotheca]